MASTSKIVRTYTTKSRDVGAEVTKRVSSDGKVSYSYIGKWGAGSGISELDMQRNESLWISSKRGFSLMSYK